MITVAEMDGNFQTAAVSSIAASLHHFFQCRQLGRRYFHDFRDQVLQVASRHRLRFEAKGFCRLALERRAGHRGPEPLSSFIPTYRVGRAGQALCAK
jgi:hypothetical protein